MELISRDAIDYVVQGHSLTDLINYHEQAVLAVMREIYAGEAPPCGCSLCVEDIYALSLNSLPPRYIQATSVHSYETSANFIHAEEIRQKVSQAAEKVGSRPNH
jgi:competence protein ComFB